MNKNRKFNLVVAASLAGFLIYNLLVWNLFTEDLVTSRYSDGGDLARLGYITGIKQQRRKHQDLPIRHFRQEAYAGQQVDLITIGDSFTNGGGEGRNNFYQDYIASLNNFSVMNIEPFKEVTILQLAYIYLNNGYFDRVKPKYLLLSVGEKYAVERFSSPLDPGFTVSDEKLGTFKRYGYYPVLSQPKESSAKALSAFISEANFRFPLYNFLYLFSDKVSFSTACKTGLDREMFSVKKGNTLLYYKDDVKKIGKATDENISAVNNNLNQLADLLARKGIKLYFMPCADKYNLYYDFIAKKRHPPSRFFEKIRPLKKSYILIDTKEILLPELKSGVKDLYYGDDTHWSWKASEKIFSTVKFDKSGAIPNRVGQGQ